MLSDALNIVLLGRAVKQGRQGLGWGGLWSKGNPWQGLKYLDLHQRKEDHFSRTTAMWGGLSQMNYWKPKPISGYYILKNYKFVS